MKQSIHAQLNDSQWLTDQIIKHHKNCAQIARELGIANRSAVNRAVKKLGLSNRVFRTHFPKLSDEKWLIKELKTKTLIQVASELGTTSGNVGDRVKRFGIRLSSSRSEAIKQGIKKANPNGRSGERASNWKGGRRMQNGYIKVFTPKHPNAVNGSVFEHRLVAEKMLGRYLKSDEVVHHLNGDKLDNSPKNLEVHNRRDHFHQHYMKGETIKGLTERILYLEALLDTHSIKH